MTTLLHQLPDHSNYDRRMQDAEFALLQSSATAQKLMAENHTGLPF